MSAKSPAIAVHADFDGSMVHLHVSKEIDSQGNEGAILIQVDFPAVYETEYWGAYVAGVIVLVLDAIFKPVQSPGGRGGVGRYCARQPHLQCVTSKNLRSRFQFGLVASATVLFVRRTRSGRYVLHGFHKSHGDIPKPDPNERHEH
jgi:hypothetical protein